MKRYEKYKNSGVERIGEIPAGWNVKRLKHFAKICNGKDQKEVLIDEGGYPVFGTGGEFGRASTFLYDKPSVLLGRKGTIDKPFYIEEPFWTVDTLFYTQIKENTNPKYFFYLCKTIPFDFYQESSAVPSMTQENLNEILFSSPSLSEQTTIAAFLDHKTAQIDALIEKKEQLIEKLKAQRQAIINEAVTKGLNPNAPMKDSGIEWLGDIPEHWETGYLKRFANNITDGSHFSPETQVEGRNYISVKDIGETNNIDLVNCKKISDDDFIALEKNGCRPRKNDVLITKDGTIGRAAIVDENNDFVILSSLGLITPNINVLLPQYLRFLLISELNVSQMFSLIAGAALTRLTIDKIKHIIVTVPTINEQSEICEMLMNREISHFKSVEVIEESIDKLKLYRQSLISEAVTGKIDVRDWETITTN